jgi:hypothetical protein
MVDVALAEEGILTMSDTPQEQTETPICNRIYETGGAYTARNKDGVATCISCGHPVKEHKHE